MTDAELGEAMDRHWAKFRAHPPMAQALHADDYPALVEAIDKAIRRGRAMTEAEVLAIGGTEAQDMAAGPEGEPPPRL